MEREYFDCISECEVLRIAVERDREHSELDLFEIAIYSRHPDVNWKARFRHIWRILRYGKPFNDNIVFERDTFERFKQSINKIN
jgi:hypothetical protein